MDTERSPAPEDEDTDPHGGTVATGIVELELAELDQRGLLLWLCRRVAGLGSRLAVVEANTSLVAHQDRRLGTEVAGIREDVDSLPCRLPDCDGCGECRRAAE